MVRREVDMEDAPRVRREVDMEESTDAFRAAASPACTVANNNNKQQKTLS